MDYDIYLDENGFNSREISFKDYRNSTYGQETLSDIYELIPNIFPVASKSRITSFWVKSLIIFNLSSIRILLSFVFVQYVIAKGELRDFFNYLF